MMAAHMIVERAPSFHQSQEYFDAQSTVSDNTPPNLIDAEMEDSVVDVTEGKTSQQKTCVLVIGPSGAGKSTFVAAASQLDEDSSIVGHGLDSCKSSFFGGGTRALSQN